MKNKDIKTLYEVDKRGHKTPIVAKPNEELILIKTALLSNDKEKKKNKNKKVTYFIK